MAQETTMATGIVSLTSLTSTPAFNTASNTDITSAPSSSTWDGLGGDAGVVESENDSGQNAIKFILPVIGVLIGVFFLICIVRIRHLISVLAPAGQ